MAGLADIPFYGGYIQQKQLNQQESLGNLQQAQAAMAMQAQAQKMQEAQRQRQELEQLKPILTQFNGDPEKTVKALLATGSPQAYEMASKIKGLIPPRETEKVVGNTLLSRPDASGQRKPLFTAPPSEGAPPEIIRLTTLLNKHPEGTPTRKAIEARIAHLSGGSEKQSTLARLITERDKLPPGDPRRQTYDNAIRKESETAKQISPTVVMPRQQQWKEIADPLNEQSVIVVNPDVYNEKAYKRGDRRGVLGKGQKMTETGRIDAKTQLTMTGLGADLTNAEDLLSGVVRTSSGDVVKGNLPTGSGLGALYDTAAGFIGMSPAGAEEAASLKAIAARLVGRIPRFEGQQSDKDVKIYQQAAGDVGNDNLPRARRLAAIKTMRRIYEGYESGKRGRLVGNRRAADQNQGAQPTVVDW